MRHSIDVDGLGPRGAAMAAAIESCVHCGFCLPTCPTYVALGEELDSPRGRIVLMKTALEGELELEEALPAVDNCLGCQACVTACPSGVEYGDLITAFRAHAEPRPLGRVSSAPIARSCSRQSRIGGAFASRRASVSSRARSSASCRARFERSSGCCRRGSLGRRRCRRSRRRPVPHARAWRC
jgi:Fe-S oxidoreductase